MTDNFESRRLIYILFNLVLGVLAFKAGLKAYGIARPLYGTIFFLFGIVLLSLAGYWSYELVGGSGSTGHRRTGSDERK